MIELKKKRGNKTEETVKRVTAGINAKLEKQKKIKELKDINEGGAVTHSEAFQANLEKMKEIGENLRSEFETETAKIKKEIEKSA